MAKMTGATTSVTLYLMLLFLSACVAALSIALLKITWRGHPPTAAGSRPASENDGAQDANRKGAVRKYSIDDLQEYGQDLYRTDPYNYQRTYEPIGDVAKEKRIQDAQDRQNIRLALSSLAQKGYYAFEDIVTEAGAIDYLVISRFGIHKIYVYTREGHMWRDKRTKLMIYCDGETRYNEDTGENILVGHPLPENPEVVAHDITKIIDRELKRPNSLYSYSIYCFTRASISRDMEINGDPTPMFNIIDLAWALDLKDENRYSITDARKHELADQISEIFMREPIVRPLEVESER